MSQAAGNIYHICTRFFPWGLSSQMPVGYDPSCEVLAQALTIEYTKSQLLAGGLDPQRERGPNSIVRRVSN